MSSTGPDPVPYERLRQFLREMEEKGVSQSEIATRTQVPRQYLTDVKMGRRGFTELFAKRLDEEFEYDYQWFMGKSDHRVALRRRLHDDKEHFEQERGSRMLVPILSEPVHGNPHAAISWDGSQIQLVGAAASRAGTADQCYVLRCNSDDGHGRLRRHDLLLISQSPNADAEYQVVASRRKLYIARQLEPRGWEPLGKTRTIVAEAERVGHCIGIIWGAL